MLTTVLGRSFTMMRIDASGSPGMTVVDSSATCMSNASSDWPRRLSLPSCSRASWERFDRGVSLLDTGLGLRMCTGAWTSAGPRTVRDPLDAPSV